MHYLKCCLYTGSESELKSLKYSIPYIYLHLSLLGVMPDPLGYFKEH